MGQRGGAVRDGVGTEQPRESERVQDTVGGLLRFSPVPATDKSVSGVVSFPTFP